MKSRILIVQEKLPEVKHEKKGNSEKLIVEGLALPFGKVSRNGVEYTKNSIIENKDTMVGRSVLWNHDDSIPSLGHVESVEVKNDGLYYRMVLDETDPFAVSVAKKIENKHINNVSIQAMVESAEEEYSEDAQKVNVTDFLELTVCNIPGFPQTTATMSQSFDGETAVMSESAFVKKLKLNGDTMKKNQEKEKLESEELEDEESSEESTEESKEDNSEEETKVQDESENKDNEKKDDKDDEEEEPENKEQDDTSELEGRMNSLESQLQSLQSSLDELREAFDKLVNGETEETNEEDNSKQSFSDVDSSEQGTTYEQFMSLVKKSIQGDL